MGGSVLIALDIDGVLNPLRRDQPGVELLRVGPWNVQWRPSVARAIKALLRRPGVQAAWLTKWLEMPEVLDEYARLTGLQDVVAIRAEHPRTTTANQWGMKVTEIDERFPVRTSLEPASGLWWKFRAAELLIARHRPDRFVWIDDDLGAATGELAKAWRPEASTATRLLLRPRADIGLMPRELRRLDDWLVDGRVEDVEDEEAAKRQTYVRSLFTDAHGVLWQVVGAYGLEYFDLYSAPEADRIAIAAAIEDYKAHRRRGVREEVDLARLRRTLQAHVEVPRVEAYTSGRRIPPRPSATGRGDAITAVRHGAELLLLDGNHRVCAMRAGGQAGPVEVIVI